MLFCNCRKSHEGLGLKPDDYGKTTTSKVANCISAFVHSQICTIHATSSIVDKRQGLWKETKSVNFFANLSKLG